MRKNYTYQYQLLTTKLPYMAMPPIPEEGTEEDYVATLAYRNYSAVLIRDRLNVLNTWRVIMKNIITPILLGSLLIGMNWMVFLILLLFVGIVALYIWAKMRMYHQAVALTELIDTVLNDVYKMQLPNILDYS